MLSRDFSRLSQMESLLPGYSINNRTNQTTKLYNQTFPLLTLQLLFLQYVVKNSTDLRLKRASIYQEY